MSVFALLFSTQALAQDPIKLGLTKTKSNRPRGPRAPRSPPSIQDQFYTMMLKLENVLHAAHRSIKLGAANYDMDISNEQNY